MAELGKMLVGFGILLIVVGGGLWLASRTGIPRGRMPGDMAYRGKSVQVYFPLGTSILISIVLSAIFYLVSRFRR